VSATIAARFIGGPYDGQVENVPADYDRDKLIGLVPALRTIRRAQPPEFRLVPSGQPESDVMRDLYYDCQHRGGEWVYVLHGTDPAVLPEKTDPVLETLLAHIRREWPNRRVFEKSTSVDVYVHMDGGDRLEEYVSKRLLLDLHDVAGAENMMLLSVDGPRWQQTESGYHDTCTIRGTAIRRCWPRKEAGA
jgi:hypothetical protein